ncbi:MAG: hypothetical protein Q9223_004850 [Gallowayella weberi]
MHKSKRGYSAFPGFLDVIMCNVLTKSPAKLMLQNFTYYDNYIDLIRMELNALDSVTRGARPRKFAVLGSGPLPMTSLCISQSYNGDEDAVVVHNVDRDASAISKSTALCRRLGYPPEQVGFHCADVEGQAFDLRGFDVVYLAGLVGSTNEQKQSIIGGIVQQMSPGAMLVLRSAHSMRSLLYPVVLNTSLTAVGLKPLLIVHPCNHIINSVVICQIESTRLEACIPQESIRKAVPG